jgi:hypothetical protein
MITLDFLEAVRGCQREIRVQSKVRVPPLSLSPRPAAALTA